MLGDKTKTLGKMAKDITVGYVGSMASEYIEIGVPFLRSLNVRPYRFDSSDLKYVSKAFHQKIKKSALRPGDVVTVRTGNPGTSCVIPECLPDANCSDLVVIRCGANLDPYFVSYYINSVMHSQVKNQLVGAIQQHFNIGAAKGLNFPDISKEHQKKIAAVLSTLDAKIELNNRINAELEAMAKTLYDYWFVQFDFPFDFAQGKPDAKGRPYKSSGGKMVYNAQLKREIPEGWSCKNLQCVADTASGGTPLRQKKEYYEAGNITWINSGELHSPYIMKGKNFITESGLKNSNAKLFPSGTLLVAMYGATAGKVSLLLTEACCNQAICAITPHDSCYLLYLKFVLSDLYNRMVVLSSGSARDNLSQETIKNLTVLDPEVDALKNFDQILKSTVGVIANNILKNRQLTALRDWLLPMLMNGQVRVA